MKQNETFEYAYSAKQQAEIDAIRKKYLPKSEDKMELLRKLDESVTRKGTIVSLALGIAGTLVLDIGICCCLEWALYLPGIFVGIFGMGILLAAYPAFCYVTKKEKERIAPMILQLTEELSVK